MAQNLNLLRVFETEQKDLILFAMVPNSPSIVAHINYEITETSPDESLVTFNVKFLPVCEKGFIDNLEDYFKLLFYKTFLDKASGKFNYSFNYSYIPEENFSQFISGFKLTFDVTAYFFKTSTISKRYGNMKLLPKGTTFVNSTSFKKYLLDTFSYEMKEVVFKMPANVLQPLSFKTEDYWSHPLIAANPDNFKPEIDPDLVDVIKTQSPDYAWAMNYLSHIDPANPNKNILFIGPAGVGKSETVRAIAHVLNLPYAEFTFTRTSEFSDAAGKITATASDEAKDWIFKQTDVAAVLQSGGIVNLEEITAMIESHQIEGNNIIAGLNRYLYSNGHKIKIHPDVIFFGTMNVAYGGLSRLQTAFASRWKRRNYVAPSSDIVASYYVKKYDGLVDKSLMTKLVDLSFKIGEVLERTPSFSKDDPHFGPAPAVHNRNRRELIFDILSNPDSRVVDVVRNFIEQQIHTNYFPKELVDKVMVDIASHVETMEAELMESMDEYETPVLKTPGSNQPAEEEVKTNTFTVEL